jgi:hypothetical protein
MFAVTNMQAQIKFGPKVGLNLSTMTLKSSGVSFDPKTYVGFNAGVIAEISLPANLALQPGIFYSAKGSKFTFGEESGTISPSFIEIPVNVLYKFDVGGLKIFVNAGPYFAYGIGGKIKSGSESQDIEFGSAEKDDLKPLDIGLNVGAGVEISNIIISANYGLGLANLSPVTTNDTEMKIKVIGFSLGYLFGGK